MVFKLNFKRLYFFYEISYIIPSFLLNVMQLLQFWFPIRGDKQGNVDRLGFSITTILQTVQLQFDQETSRDTTWLDVFFTTGLVFQFVPFFISQLVNYTGIQVTPITFQKFHHIFILLLNIYDRTLHVFLDIIAPSPRRDLKQLVHVQMKKIDIFRKFLKSEYIQIYIPKDPLCTRFPNSPNHRSFNTRTRTRTREVPK